MNSWKVAFISLASIMIILLVTVMYLAISPIEDAAVPAPSSVTGSVLEVQTTTVEFEQIAKKYLADAIKDSPIDVKISIDEEIHLFSDLIIFGITVPIQMDFEPEVHQGNIRLKQTNVHVGKLNIPPGTVLKLVKDSVDFPAWIIVRPDNEEIYVDLSSLNIADGNRVRAKEVDLKGNNIILEIVIPTK